jgi:23S rRNA C2498 (ribose-2'-O)-methylase RlmM
LYYFCLTAYGSESALKAEVESLKSSLKPGFFKKGFVTFSSTQHESLNLFDGTVFSYLSGSTLDLIKDVDDDQIISKLIEYKIKYKTQSVLVLGRERVERQNEDEDFQKFIFLKKDQYEQDPISKKTLCLIYLEKNEVCLGLADTKNFITASMLLTEQKVPSRAYYKAKESCLKFNINFESNASLVELGAAPGGSCQYYLEQGLTVYGVDPSEIDSKLLKNKKFKHLKKTSGQIAESDFTGTIHYLAMDMNVKPEIALLELKKSLLVLKHIKLALLTFKMPKKDQYNDLLPIFKRLEKLGFKNLKAKQLLSNRQEVFVMAKK